MNEYRPDGNPVLIIGGGVGPMAGVELHRKIIEQTKTTGIDQDHFDLVHVSVSRTVGDRTEYLMGNRSVNPGTEMAAAVGLGMAGLPLENGFLEYPVVVGVPCNTFHAPRIFSRFEEEMSPLGSRLTLIHMLKETVGLIRRTAPKARNIGLLATTGTRESRVWHDLLEGENYSVLEISMDTQEQLHEAIYNRSWGLKAISPASKEAKDRFERYTEKLIEAGAEMIVLGCTEIPLALPDTHFKGVPLIDPVFALARAMISAADPERLKRYQNG